MEFYFYVILFIATIAFGIYKQVTEHKERHFNRRLTLKTISALEGFRVRNMLMDVNSVYGFAIDDSQERFCFIKPGVRTRDIIPFSNILGVEIIEDGNTISYASRSSQAAGALIGGLAFGGVGAIIGGLSGSRRQSRKVSKLQIRVTVLDSRNQVVTHSLDLLSEPIKTDNQLFTDAMNNARNWKSLLENLIKKADREDSKKTDVANKQEHPLSVADELTKLAGLKKEGILTEEEFEQQKNKLLS